MAEKTYVVTAPLVVATREDGSHAYVYQGANLPGGLAEGEAERLLDGDFVEESKAPADDDSEKGPSVKDVLADVGDDKEKAAAALEAENAKGDKARSSLVTKLEAIVNAE